MGRVTRASDRHIIWSNRSLDVDDWREDYKDIPSGNIRDCLYADTDYTEWYVDKYGDLRADAIHHDGTNHYLYRVFKEGVSETQMENLKIGRAHV